MKSSSSIRWPIVLAIQLSWLCFPSRGTRYSCLHNFWREPSDHRLGAAIEAHAILDNKRPVLPTLSQEALVAPQQQPRMSRQLDMESGSADSFAGADWPSLEPGSVSQGLQSPMNPVLLEKDYQANLADACWRTSGSSASRGPKNKHVRIKPCLKGGTNRKYWPHEGFMNTEGTNSEKSAKLVPAPPLPEAATVTPSNPGSGHGSTNTISEWNEDHEVSPLKSTSKDLLARPNAHEVAQCVGQKKRGRSRRVRFQDPKHDSTFFYNPAYAEDTHDKTQEISWRSFFGGK
ncbi:hypothetical protein PGTUg99_022645 [Puccinia graminis f. sp. tritici]|uniref:Uncharacterized protein n=1 Tax=Puccinia graminis f. sp. tritici TaxID=56615 RepID=A0A5B0SHK0_PUCGR|nr:hypothetical protein PGTUg99_022645 [Puccinia graminis f. sp. tritici]